MSHKLIVTPAAQQDLEQALAYYLNIRLSLAEQFIAAVEVTYKKIETEPQHYSFFGTHKMIRSATLQRFPYLVVFQIREEAVYVFGLHNTHQDPEPILKRI